MRNRFFSHFDFDGFRNRVESTEEVVRIFNELYQIRWKLNGYDEIKFFLENNTVSLEKRKQILSQFVASFMDDISAYTLALLFFLMQEKVFHKLGYFINVLKMYYAEEANLMMVEVISRYPINDTDLNVYKASLEFIYKKRVEYIHKERKSLIGGFKLRWHTGEIDLTVKRKINRMNQLIQQGR